MKTEITHNLVVPYLSHTISTLDRFSTYNIACLGMCLKYWGVFPEGNNTLLIDSIYDRAQSEGLNRFSPQGLKSICESFGIKDDMTTGGSLADIRKAIDDYKPVIINGFFTQPGHLVVVTGYNDTGFLVHDPLGKLLNREGQAHWVYEMNYLNYIYGESIIYSNRVIAAACSAWNYHQTAILFSEMAKSDIENINNIWMHRIG